MFIVLILEFRIQLGGHFWLRIYERSTEEKIAAAERFRQEGNEAYRHLAEHLNDEEQHLNAAGILRVPSHQWQGWQKWQLLDWRGQT